ncbi:uncharacterized protein LOC141899932 [Tubulanus polymorphus]|uniref:uncharacterized protein LOC141899932 n=1 Tax=Tubulanus polymorphus TaxID=672921 RepID=UPI003DA29191
MALDFRAKTYRPLNRYDTRLNTSYGKMTTWYRARNQLSDPDRDMIRNNIVLPTIPNSPMKPELNHIPNPLKVKVSGGNFYIPRPFTLPDQGARPPYAASDCDLTASLYKTYEANFQPGKKSDAVHLQYYRSGGYDDFHKAFLTHKLNRQKPSEMVAPYGPAQTRNGNVGSNWRHIKSINEARGIRNAFIDGQVSLDDLYRMDKEESKLSPQINKRPPMTKRVIKSLDNDLDAIQAIEKRNWYLVR